MTTASCLGQPPANESITVTAQNRRDSTLAVPDRRRSVDQEVILWSYVLALAGAGLALTVVCLLLYA